MIYFYDFGVYEVILIYFYDLLVYMKLCWYISMTYWCIWSYFDIFLWPIGVYEVILIYFYDLLVYMKLLWYISMTYWCIWSYFDIFLWPIGVYEVDYLILCRLVVILTTWLISYSSSYLIKIIVNVYESQNRYYLLTCSDIISNVHCFAMHHKYGLSLYNQTHICAYWYFNL